MLKADLLLSIRRAGEHFLDLDNRRFRRICSTHITDTRRPSWKPNHILQRATGLSNLDAVGNSPPPLSRFTAGLHFYFMKY